MAEGMSCESCGAWLKPATTVCDLCGEPVAHMEEAEEAAVANDAEKSIAAQSTEPAPLISRDPALASTASTETPAGVFCNQCGWKNPLGARFCSRCGSPLQELEEGSAAAVPASTSRPPVAAADRPPSRPPEPSQPTEDKEASQAELGKQITIIVGAGVMLVILLYAITMMSAGFNPTVSGSNAGGPPSNLAVTPPAFQEDAPLPPQVATRVDELQAELEGLEGEAQTSKQIELVNLYIGAGRPDLAAVVQEEVATAMNTPDAWARAGNLYYDWMDVLEGPRKTEVARLTIAAYDKVLAMQPDNLDVRATKAIAHLYDPSNPMAAIEETNAVLEADPNHIQANFNRGLMLMQINRTEAAREQFEKLKTIVGEASPLYEQAEAIIQSLSQ